MALTLTDIRVAQMACVEVGLEPISTFTDGTTESLTLDLHYETIKGDALSQHYWRFGCAQVELQQLLDVPASRWQYAFQLPPEVIAIRALTVHDRHVPFERYDDKIYCDVDNTNPLILDAMFNTVEAKWEPYFTRYVVLKLAAILASGVREDAAMSKLKEEMADIQWRLAKNTDSKGRTTSRMRPERITNGRLRRNGLYNSPFLRST